MKKEHLKLSEADEKYLTEFLRKGQAKGRVMRRVTARLQLNQGATLQAVAEPLKVAHGTVSTWRNKYLTTGLRFFQDEPRSGRPIEIDGAQRAQITALACSATPEGRAKGSLR